MTERTCGTCRHFHPDSGDLRVGQCRAREPSPVMLGLRQSPAGSVPVVEGFFAPVRRVIWCGDFAPKLLVMS